MEQKICHLEVKKSTKTKIQKYRAKFGLTTDEAIDRLLFIALGGKH